MRKEQAEAKKRSILRRYLVLSGIELDTDNWTLSLLQALVRGLHMKICKNAHLSYAWPLSAEQVKIRAKENHYVKNLVAMKIMFGSSSGIGCVVGPGCNTIQCCSVADLVKIGWVSANLQYLDQHIHKILTPACDMATSNN